MGKVTPERIKYFRKRLGLKQEELAELCGVDASCISRWEIWKVVPIRREFPAASQGTQGYG